MYHFQCIHWAPALSAPKQIYHCFPFGSLLLIYTFSCSFGNAYGILTSSEQQVVFLNALNTNYVS